MIIRKAMEVFDLLVDRIFDWLFPYKPNPELDRFAEMSDAFEERVSGLEIEQLRQFAHLCLKDRDVFTVKHATTPLQLRCDVDPYCMDIYTNYEEITAEGEDWVVLSREGVKPLQKERKFDRTVKQVDTSDFTIVGGTYNPKNSMLLQPTSSSEIYELSDYEPIYDVHSNPSHPARSKNIYGWRACHWYAEQADPELDPMEVKFPTE